eukprot:CAMPEP_0205945650 /NCGR_PEP_ID=MMETSP1325-20131115/66770_1 /ASSEMBLY_ACC=CAM_ASM_000708 /TAXON_ID=236786 /ORGANISM="Florenciella sp., Strain RCC1007" /LENGTH=65 /DNA_ID=CAMNT_0053316649 /DNA_START=26 /DNA_END=219 /DNA_ORIENTATION=+
MNYKHLGAYVDCSRLPENREKRDRFYAEYQARREKREPHYAEYMARRRGMATTHQDPAVVGGEGG